MRSWARFQPVLAPVPRHVPEGNLTLACVTNNIYRAFLVVSAKS